jgi:hypothetical protein
MSENSPELEQAVDIALTLSPIDKVRLVEQVMATLEQELETAPVKPRRSLLGALSKYGVAPSAEEIDEVCREMWGEFPRSDIE